MRWMKRSAPDAPTRPASILRPATLAPPIRTSPQPSVAKEPLSKCEQLTQGDRLWPDLAMKRVKIAELKDHLSSHLRAVERGATIEVTDRERPIARIVPT